MRFTCPSMGNPTIKKDRVQPLCYLTFFFNFLICFHFCQNNGCVSVPCDGRLTDEGHSRDLDTFIPSTCVLTPLLYSESVIIK